MNCPVMSATQLSCYSHGTKWITKSDGKKTVTMIHVITPRLVSMDLQNNLKSFENRWKIHALKDTDKNISAGLNERKKVKKIKLHVIARTNDDRTPELWIISISVCFWVWHLAQNISEPERESERQALGSEIDTKIETKEHQLIQRFDDFDIIFSSFVVRSLGSSVVLERWETYFIRICHWPVTQAFRNKHFSDA